MVDKILSCWARALDNDSDWFIWCICCCNESIVVSEMNSFSFNSDMVLFNFVLSFSWASIWVCNESISSLCCFNSSWSCPLLTWKLSLSPKSKKPILVLSAIWLLSTGWENQPDYWKQWFTWSTVQEPIFMLNSIFQKFHTYEEGGAHLRISFSRLLMNLKNK